MVHMKVFLVRHAESKLNALRMHQYSHTELSEYGTRQAKILARRLARVKADLIISSNYKRSVQTAEIINRVVKKKIVYTELLNEMKTPSEVQGKIQGTPAPVKIFGKILAHMDEPSWHYSDEDNVHDFRRRIKRFLSYLSKRKEKSIIVVTHGHVIRMILGILLFGDSIEPKRFYDLMEFLHTKNASITELELNEKGEWSLVTWNDYSHLK
jgi:broad specificity phosphatase PhoE